MTTRSHKKPMHINVHEAYPNSFKTVFPDTGSHKTYVYEKNIIWKSSAYPDHIDRM